MSETIQVFSKPFDEMSFEELKLERRAHGWMRNKLTSCAKHLTLKLYALRQKPIYTKEEYTKMYEDGEISKKEYQTTGARMAKLKRNIAATEAEIQYGFALVDHENAICVYLDELIDQHKARYMIDRKKGKGGKPVYDPRRNISWTNHNEKNRTENLRPPSKSGRYEKKWSAITEAEKSAEVQFRKLQPIDTWNKDKLKQIAKDRGIHTEPVLIQLVSEELHTSMYHAERILESGKMTWGEIILIASMLEMTPMEFCDCFLAGVFQEVVDGKWVAVAENKDALRAKLPALRAKPNGDSQEPSDVD